MTEYRELIISKRERQIRIPQKTFRPRRSGNGKPVFVVLEADIINDLNRQAGTTISLKDRKAAPALGSRFLRSYVPLRCVPNESVSARDMAVPAYVGQIFLIHLYGKDRFAGKTLDLF